MMARRTEPDRPIIETFERQSYKSDRRQSAKQEGVPKDSL
jgi:hypothetical protein